MGGRRILHRTHRRATWTVVIAPRAARGARRARGAALVCVWECLQRLRYQHVQCLAALSAPAGLPPTPRAEWLAMAKVERSWSEDSLTR